MSRHPLSNDDRSNGAPTEHETANLLCMLTTYPFTLENKSLDEILHISSCALEEASVRLSKLYDALLLESVYGLRRSLAEDRSLNGFTYLCQDQLMGSVQMCNRHIKAVMTSTA